MKNYWFTSDTHFSHKDCIGFFDRPWATVKEMNEGLIIRWNERVKPEDEIYHLGDIAFFTPDEEGKKTHPKEILNKLNGKITYICGNHDEAGRNKLTILNHRLVLKISNIYVNLIHDPEHGNLNYELNICGDVHKLWKVKIVKRLEKKSLFINVGVDVWNYRPVSWQKIYEIYTQWKSGKDVEAIYNQM